MPARWLDGRTEVECTDGLVCARGTLHVVISILGSARVILRSLKVQMSRDRLSILLKLRGHLSYIREVTLRSSLYKYNVLFRICRITVLFVKCTLKWRFSCSISICIQTKLPSVSRFFAAKMWIRVEEYAVER